MTVIVDETETPLPEFIDGEIYSVDWLDSGMQMNPQWDTVASHMANWQLNDMRVRSVGTLVYVDDDVIGLGLSISNAGEQVFGLQLIVRVNILTARKFDAE